MMNFLNGGYFSGWGWGPFVIILMIWSLFWKGFALWRSAQNKQGWWFLILLVVNTMGILEIVYLFAVDGGKFWQELQTKLGKRGDVHHEHEHHKHEHHEYTQS